MTSNCNIKEAKYKIARTNARIYKIKVAKMQVFLFENLQVFLMQNKNRTNYDLWENSLITSIKLWEKLDDTVNCNKIYYCILFLAKKSINPFLNVFYFKFYPTIGYHIIIVVKKYEIRILWIWKN